MAAGRPGNLAFCKRQRDSPVSDDAKSVGRRCREAGEERVRDRAVAARSSGSGLEPEIEVTLGTQVLEVREHRVREAWATDLRSEEHTSELQSRGHLVCRLLLEK